MPHTPGALCHFQSPHVSAGRQVDALCRSSSRTYITKQQTNSNQPRVIFAYFLFNRLVAAL